MKRSAPVAGGGAQRVGHNFCEAVVVNMSWILVLPPPATPGLNPF